jgi:hypothetical protein
MSARHPDQHAPALGPGRFLTVVEGMAAMAALVTLVATLLGLGLWAIVQLLLAFFS